MKRLMPMLLAAAAGAVAAQSLPDPTRPPGAAQGAGGAVQGGIPLQTIIIPERGKPSAVINGERVQVGGRVGEAQVVRITETEVVLKGPEGMQTLRMTPDVVKKPAAQATTGRGKESGPARQGVQ